MNLSDYDDIRSRVERGQIVAIAPAIDGQGNHHLIGLAGTPTALNLYHLQQASLRERARFAIRAVHQARCYYGLDH